MPYDDLMLNALGGYFKSQEPGMRERADAWATAIGLQKVDGLTPSDFLLETAKLHIEGKITQNQARRRIGNYYAAKGENAKPDPGKEEPDKVSERIVAVINDGAFEFTPEYFISIHAKLFKGVLQDAGKLRNYNIRKHEWVLKDDSVTYGSADTLKASLVRNFIDEREYDYGSKTARQMIPHFARFVSRIWQVHPFPEGNTRTVAVFAVKYLKSLGYSVADNMFKENSWYFRNALVRANYADYAKGVKRDWSYLEAFFRNLLLGERNELKSRYLLITLTEEDKKKIRALSEPAGNKSGPQRAEKAAGKGCQKTQRLSEKGCQKRGEKLLALVGENPTVTQAAMAKALGISRQAVQKHIASLKAAARLKRIGPDKGGHWQIMK